MLLAGGWATPVAAQRAPWPTNGWATSTPALQGLANEPIAQLIERTRGGEFGHIDRLVIVRNGYLVTNERFPQDYRAISRGRRGALGCGEGACRDSGEVHQFNYLHPDFHPWHAGRDVHTLQSVTKSVTSALIGIAVTRGEITGTQAPLLSFFDDYDLSRVDARLRRATLDDLLTMRTGIEWHEQDRPLDETNTTWQLENSRDWVRFTLDQPMDAEPGEKWVYNSGGSHLMSAVLRRATGLTADRYAELHLFGPLGIRDYHWKLTPTGLPDTEGGLYLEAEQLARIGYLFLRGGEWDGRRIISADWVSASTDRRVDRVNAQGWGYGYQWWRLDRGSTVIWAGLGFGGQFLLVLPQHDIVGVVNSWNLFGGAQSSILGAFIEALITSTVAPSGLIPRRMATG
ncbi:MAG: beta-lactamase family protein [Gemmatimonadetes bacterium]|nr:beta-lactamase family protein [Gemmatimonadota bacterium]